MNDQLRIKQLEKEVENLKNVVKTRNVRVLMMERTIKELEKMLVDQINDNENYVKQIARATEVHMPIQKEEAQEASPVVSGDEPTEKEAVAETTK